MTKDIQFQFLEFDALQIYCYFHQNALPHYSIKIGISTKKSPSGSFFRNVRAEFNARLYSHQLIDMIKLGPGSDSCF
jgi:hypothetical protein